MGELTADLLRETLPPRYGVPTVADAARVDGSVVRETDVFVFHDLGDAASDIVPAVEDDPLTNAVYLEQWSSSNAITSRADVLNSPESVVRESNGAAPVEFTIEEAHPIFDGVGGPGDTVEIHGGGFVPAVSWFSGVSGETLAEVQAGSVGGPAATIDPEYGSVLLSSLGVTGSVGPEEYTAEAGQILANAVEFAQPPELSGEFFQVSGLTAPAQADTGAMIDVSATVTNVGNESGTQTVVEFTDVPLPGEGGVFEHGVRTAPYEGEVLQVTNLNDTVSDSGAIPLNRTTAFTLASGDDVETGYQRGQSLDPDAPPDPVGQDRYTEEISIVPAGPPNVTVANLRIAGQGDNATVVEGSYDVTMSGSTDGVSGTLTLSMDDSDDGTTDDGGSGDGSGPGFGPGAVLAGVAGAGDLLRRRVSNDETDSS